MRVEPNGPWCNEQIKINGVWHYCVIVKHDRDSSHHEATAIADSGETVQFIWKSENA